MGRKNRNARARAACVNRTFQDLKEPTIKFNLDNVKWMTPKKARTHTKDAEVSVSIGQKSKSDAMYISFSFRKDAWEELSAVGSSFKAGIVAQGIYERLYIIGSIPGYKLYEAGGGGERKYLRVLIQNYPEVFEKYVGAHDLQYDEENAAFYITANK